jgi:hypothetical protein
MSRQCHATTMPFLKRLLKATTQRGMGAVWHRLSIDGMWATSPRSDSSGYHADFHEGHGRHCRRMAGARHGMCEFTRHGMTGKRHGRGMACVNWPFGFSSFHPNILRFLHMSISVLSRYPLCICLYYATHLSFLQILPPTSV